MRELRVNAFTAVDNSKIRRETVDGREYVIVPSSTLPANVVMNSVLYPVEETARTYKQLDGKLAPLGHPKDAAGNWISAGDPVAIHANHIGAFNRNVTLGEDGRVHAEKWIDVLFANATERGPEVLAAIEKGEPISTSIAVWLRVHPVAEGLPYTGRAEYLAIDHDAILIGETPAAGTDQGVGLFVNVDAGTLTGMTQQEKHEVLRAAGVARWPELYVWLADFTDQTAVFELEQRADGPALANRYVAVDYEMSGAVANLAETVRPAVRKSQWQILANSVFNRGALNFDVQTTTQEAVDMTPEQIKELREGIGADLKVNAAEAVSGALAPVLDRLTALEAQVGKGEAAETEALRTEVATHIGADAAAELSVNALRTTLAKVKPATDVPEGQLSVNRSDVKPRARAEMPK
ncbi:MAG: hypothetical protein RSE94_02265 [Pseudomonas sp.]